jgi:plastocyanin
MKKLAILVLILTGLMMLGCLGGETPANETNESTPPPPPPVVKNPSFTVTAPSNGQLITVSGESGDVTLTISTQNLVLKTPGGAAKKGEGYFKVTLDSNAPETVTTKVYTLSSVPVGEHSLKVELYNNDNTPYSPAISRSVAFTIEAEKPKEYVPQYYTVTMANNAFDPPSLTVKVKDYVTWVNEGAMPATATCTLNGKVMFDTKSIGTGKNATVQMTDEMECEYYSQLYRAMKASIIVEPNGVD